MSVSGEPSFGSLLRGLRAAAGLTQEEIAQRSGLSVRAVGGLERGTVRRPQRKTVGLLATALDLSAADARALSEAARRVPSAAAAASAAAAETESEPRIPRQLPAAPQHFTGREDQISTVTRWIGFASSSAGPPAVLAIDGMAGVGKTSLAVHLGHALAERYPDGQLFLDLHGHTPGRGPLAADAALTRLLRGLGVGEEQLGDDPEERAELWRSRASGRRLLIVLDNAAGTEQVRPLIPGHGDSLVLVTSRLRLLDLDTAAGMSLDVLPQAQAQALFLRVAGAQRAAGQEDDVREAVRLCGRLPLAIRIAAARLRHRPSWQVRDLIDRLLESAEDTAPGESQVAAAFEMSYHRLAPAQQRMFRTLSLHPGIDIDVFAAAALAGLATRPARRLLEALLDHHLLEQRVPGRYTFHDLMREYARGKCAEAGDPEADQRATDRLLDHYRYAASSAMDVLAPATRGRRPSVDPTGDDVPTPEFAAAAQALQWLDAERANLLAAAALAVEQGRAAHATQISHIAWRYLHDGGHYQDALTLHSLAVQAARGGTDRRALTSALRYYALTCERLGRFRSAFAVLEEAREICEEPEDLASVVELLGNLSMVTGQYEDAATHFDRSLALWRAAGDLIGVGNDLGNLGITHFWLGRYGTAREHVAQALAAHEELGHPASQAQSLIWLGIIAERTGGYGQARQYADRAHALATAHGLLSLEADALEVRGVARTALGDTEALTDLTRSLTMRREQRNQPPLCDSLLALGGYHQRRGEHERALDYFRQAVEATGDIGIPSTQAAALTGLGEALTALGRPESALVEHRRALELALTLGDPYRLARAHEGVGRALDAMRQREEASPHLFRAHATYALLGVPDAERLTVELAETSSSR